MPLVRGERDEVNDQVFAEINYHASYELQRAVRTSRWKYIRRFADRDTPVMSNADDSPSKELWLNHGWHKRRVDREYLFDLVFDPNEACNLAGEPGYSPILDDMGNRMGEWMRRTDDPLLSGYVPAPSGATVTDPDSLAPSGPTRTIS